MYPLAIEDVIDLFVDEALDYSGNHEEVKAYLKGMMAALPIILQELEWHEGGAEVKTEQEYFPTSLDFTCSDSSVIHRVEYWRKPKELLVHFKETNKIYSYQNVPLDIFNGLMDAQSRGKFFNQNIKNKFEFVDVTTEKGE